MQVAVFSSQHYDQTFLSEAVKASGIQLTFFDARLTAQTATLAKGFSAICVFVNDELSPTVLYCLHEYGVKHIALRCAGFNNVDIKHAKQLGISVSRVPDYSPQAVAEHAVALMLTLNRRLHKAYNRVKENNFTLDGLLGFNMHHKTVGIIGAGRIGQATMQILRGFGCQILCYDPFKPEIDIPEVRFVPLDTLLKDSDIISLHCPLTPDNQRMIDASAIAKMKPGVMLINTSRGGLVDTRAVIDALKTYHIGYLGLDVYEMESELFFQDLSDSIVQDDVFQRLLTFPNVLITGHQGFFTREALQHIASTTIHNLQLAEQGQSDPLSFLVSG
ncbi:2-hydroxyacid dehydrogenase [Bowmanella sp. JS7-9]|uniref:2-hydroxyacid dehydrogenase n=1 Tax=Pseudobowmanella zhangzhouensis TaxID=1537679 RepID=A0ABW1XM21_9ALTE|nr:2-hydroxyacid dehydrogenase [Bowmanella sp. JS7-9]TBX27325.1 2-hydroxyacid dehydrogenase [Bowmanella sp. JS7-9]